LTSEYFWPKKSSNIEPLVEKVVTRKTRQILIKKPDLGRLKVVANQLTDDQCIYFRKKYEKILGLLKIDVKVDAIDFRSHAIL
jgi:hypothetical protein